MQFQLFDIRLDQVCSMHQTLLITQLHSFMQGILGYSHRVFNLSLEARARLADQMTMEIKHICGCRFTALILLLLGPG